MHVGVVIARASAHATYVHTYVPMYISDLVVSQRRQDDITPSSDHGAYVGQTSTACIRR